MPILILGNMENGNVEFCFFARENLGKIYWPEVFDKKKKISLYDDKTKVTVLRQSLWFYTGHETTISELKKFFTDHAIVMLEESVYIKIHKQEP